MRHYLIVAGVVDEESNKSILYGAKSIKELRERFSQYEMLKKNSRTKLSVKSVREDKGKKLLKDYEVNKLKRCYNCGSKEHISTECPDKIKGPKCFKCGDFGHVASKCIKSNARGEKQRCDAINSSDKKNL